MNTHLHNFCFQRWLKNFAWMCAHITDNILIETRDNIDYEIDEGADLFFHRNHIQNEDDWLLSLRENFLEYLNNVNCFLNYIENEERSLKDIIKCIILIRYPLVQHVNGVVYNLLSGKKYITNYKKHYTLTFTPKFIDKVKEFITVSNITLKDDK